MKRFDRLVSQILMTESPIFSDNELLVNLNDEQINKQHFNICIQSGEKIEDFENWEVFKIKKESFVYFCFAKNNTIDAYAEFFVDGQNVNSKRVLQRKSQDSKGLLRKAFLNYFPNIFPSVKLDKIANTYGKQFFKKVMEEANKKKFRTVIVNEATNEEASYNSEDFEQYWSGQSIINNKVVRPNNLSFKIYYK